MFPSSGTLLERLLTNSLSDPRETGNFKPMGFGHKFDSVETGGGDEIARSHKDIVALGWKPSSAAIIADSFLAYFPRVFQNSLLRLPTSAMQTLLHFRTISEKWSTDLLRTNIALETTQSRGGEESAASTGLMASVAAANVYTKERDKLTFDEIAHQTATILVSGQDTTGNTLAWALYEIAKRPKWQDKVRQEIVEAGPDPSPDKLEYLNAHIKASTISKDFNIQTSISSPLALGDTSLVSECPVC
ncbi:hypothetical protein V5O48_006049 [Marasmius crinis-equi]|uniref:Cytochrome P450 n=1 Tax=Marasmius crinis-equi TaxID=585013 RepID=A0ABR3FKU1_9AGAR